MKAGRTRAAAGEEWRKGWRVVAGATVGLGTGYATYAYVASLFIEPLHRQFGWSRGDQAVGQTLSVLGSLIAPAVGSAVDRWGGRRVACTTIPAFAAVLIALSTMSGALRQFYLLMALLAGFGTGTTATVYMRAIAASFESSRGLALAVPRTGVALAGAIAPALLYRIIAAFGWRAGYLTLALVAVLVCLPATVLGLRPAPAPVKAPRAGREKAIAAGGRGLFRMVVFCLTLGLVIGPVTGLLSQLHPLLLRKGLGAAVAADLTSFIPGSAVAGALLTGILVDRIWAPLIGFAFTIAAAAGCALLLHPGWLPGGTAPAAALALIGLGQGAEIDLSSYLIARYFGLRHYSRLFGVSMVAVSLACAFYVYAFGASFDRWGSYNPILMAMMASLLLAAGLFLTLGRYPRMEAAEDSRPSSA